MNDTDDKDNGRSQDLHNYIDSHLRQLKWVSYGLGTVGVLIVFRKLRVSEKFRSIEQIPFHFITKNYTLQGRVREVTEEGVLLVDHTPILDLRWISNLMSKYKGTNTPNPYLHIVPAGLDMNAESVIWMKKQVSGKHAWFQMMARDNQVLHCDVRIRKNFFSRVSVSKELLEQGTCRLRPWDGPPESDGFHEYLLELVVKEHKAAKKGRGVWRDTDSWIMRNLAYVWNFTRTRLAGLFKRR